jgi:hypothetical protein
MFTTTVKHKDSVSDDWIALAGTPVDETKPHIKKYSAS